MRTPRIYITVVACLSLYLISNAQVRVVKSMSGISLLDLSGFKSLSSGAPSVFRRTLEADLIRSGWFSLIKLGRAEYTVTGTSEQDGSQVLVKCEVYHIPTKKRYLGKTYKVSADEAYKLAHRVADDIVLALTGRPGMASTRIVMVGTRTGEKELYVCDSDGKNLRQLTSDRTISVAPKWGPNGQQLAYTSYRSHFPDVYLINVNTGNRTCIADYSGLNACPAISPDGRKVALILSKGGNPDLFIKDLSSGRLTRLTFTKRAAEASPSWSPDGKQIVYVSDMAGSPQLYIINRKGGKPERITGCGSENVDPDWGSNGFIVYSSRVGRRYQIYVINPATLDIHQISKLDTDYENPSWAPDGRHIVCARTQQYQSQIFIIDTMSASCINLLPDSKTGEWYSPDWSPK